MRLNQLAWFGGGHTPSTSDKDNYTSKGILWVTSKDMKRDYIDDTQIQLTEKGAEKLYRYQPGTVLMVTRSGILRKLLPVAMLAKEATVNQDQKAIVPFLLDISDWIMTYLKANDAYIRKEFGKAGTTVESVVFDLVKAMPIAIPPLQEQHRISKKYVSSHALIQQYDSLETVREQLDAEFPIRLRKSILQAAVQGKLVPQDPSDEPASVLLERIREQRRQLIAEGKLKASKGGESVIYRASDGGYYEKRIDAKGRGSEPICIDDEIPFAIPTSWEWVRLKSLGEIVGGGTPKTNDASLWAKADKGIPWITPADMKNVRERRASHGERYLSEDGLARSSACLMPPGSVVMSSRAPIGYLAITECALATNQGFKSIIPITIETNTWIMLALDGLMDGIKKRASGTTFKEVSGSEFGETLIPIPPLTEQVCIIDCSESMIQVIE